MEQTTIEQPGLLTQEELDVLLDAAKLSVHQVFSDWDPSLVDEVEARVDAGIAWLEGHVPSWFDKFENRYRLLKDTPFQVADHVTFTSDCVADYDDPDDVPSELLSRYPLKGVVMGFEIVDMSECVLGMTVGHYQNALERFNVTVREAAAMGFDTFKDDFECPVDGVTFGHLQRMWTFKVEERLGVHHYATA